MSERPQDSQSQQRQFEERAALGKLVESQSKRMEKAKQERQSVAAQTIYLGVLGFLLVLPIIVGAFLGRWLDERMSGYSLRWTLSLIILGVAVGAVNVYLFIREK